MLQSVYPSSERSRFSFIMSAFHPPLTLLVRQTSTQRLCCPQPRDRRVHVVRSRRVPPSMVDYSRYTTPKYTGDPKEDLLISIKFNDENSFFKYLSDLGPDAVNIKWGGNRYNQSVLLACCYRGRTKMIEYLIEQGADCTHKNDAGCGAVHYSKKFYYVLKMYDEGNKIIRLLKENGAEDDDN